MKITSLLLPAAALALWAQTSASAQTIQASATQPVVGPNDRSYFGGDDFQNGDQDYSNNTAAPGQSFTTAASAAGFRLNSVTLLGNGDAGTDTGKSNVTYYASNYTLTLYSVAGTVATPLATQTFTFSPATDSYKTSYLTFALTTPLLLAGNTQYAFTVGADNGFYGFDGTAATTDTPPGLGVTTTGGNAVGIAGGVVTNYAYTRDFDVSLTAAPEPGVWALSAIGFAGLLAAYKRHSRTAVQLPV